MRARTFAAAASAALLGLAALVATPAYAHTTAHSERLVALNDSGVTGHVTVLEKDGHIRVNLNAHGLEAGQVHLQHIHGFVGGQEAACPTPALDADGDGLISFSEGLPAYGPAVITLGMDELSGQTLAYSRTFTETNTGDPVATLGPLADYVVVVHGRTVGDSYDLTLPVACAELDVAGSR